MIRLALLATFLSAAVVWQDAPSNMPKGSKIAPLEGSAKEAGYFAVRSMFPAGTGMAPHWHPVPERLTVLEGTFWVGEGPAYDEAALKAYPAGSYLSLPAGTTHFSLAKETAIVQLTTVGPWVTNFVSTSPRTSVP